MRCVAVTPVIHSSLTPELSSKPKVIAPSAPSSPGSSMLKNKEDICCRRQATRVTHSNKIISTSLNVSKVSNGHYASRGHQVVGLSSWVHLYCGKVGINLLLYTDVAHVCLSKWCDVVMSSPCGGQTSSYAGQLAHTFIRQPVTSSGRSLTSVQTYSKGNDCSKMSALIRVRESQTKVDVVHGSFLFPVFVLVGLWPSPNNGINYQESWRQVRKYPQARPWREINQQHAQTQFSLKEMDEPFVWAKSSVQSSFVTFPEKHICQWLIKKHFSLQRQKQQKLRTDVNMLRMCCFDAPWLLFWPPLWTTTHIWEWICWKACHGGGIKNVSRVLNSNERT